MTEGNNSLFTPKEVDHGPRAEATVTNTGHSDNPAIVEVTKLAIPL